MDAGTRLRQAVAGFFDVDESEVGPSFSLQTCHGSIARASLDAAIRKGVGVKSPEVYTARTFADLAAGLGIGTDGASASPPLALSALPRGSATASVAPSGSETSTAGVSCGVDVELVANLPVVADPWEDPFYRSHFSPSEIAYCLRQPEPSLHFTARWCAKEALKKCDRAFLAIEGKDLEIVHDESGAPHLVSLGSGRSQRLPHAVSLSHTTQSAVAMVVRVLQAPPTSTAPVSPVAVTATTPDPVVAVSSTEPSRRSRWPLIVLILLNLITLGLATAALYRTLAGYGGRG